MRLILYIVSLFSFLSCKPSAKKTAETAAPAPASGTSLPYQIGQPTTTHTLPPDLREISGLSYYKPGKLACVQDELGVVFIYDLTKKAVVAEHIFGENADYEGVEFVDGNLYVLRSDGELYVTKPDESGEVKELGNATPTRHIQIDLPGKNDLEGLGYDPKLEALLLATKDGKGTDKIIYYYSLKNKRLFQGLVLKQADIQAFDPSLEAAFKPSGLAVHPQTGDYYVLSSAARRLAVLAPNGTIKSVTPLPKKLLPQPEGICFSPSGTLYISSEGDGKQGILLEFAPAP